MNNKKIAKILAEVADLLSLKGEGEAFKAKAYTHAALYVSSLDKDIASLSHEVWLKEGGIGKNMAAHIATIRTTGTLPLWEELKEETPAGVLDMLHINGLGPKRIRLLWKELGLDTMLALREACESGKVAALKGFGQKTQATILKNVIFAQAHQHKWHYATVSPWANRLLESLKELLGSYPLISFTGDFRRQMEVVESLEMLIGTPTPEKALHQLSRLDFLIQHVVESGPSAWRGKLVENNIPFNVLFCDPAVFYQQLLLQTGSKGHLEIPLPSGNTIGERISQSQPGSEEAFYDSIDIPYIAPPLREGMIELSIIETGEAPSLLATTDLRGILHVHTTYSDGQNSLEQMAVQCKALGYDYLGITDHSQVAVYAGGLSSATLIKQHAEIDRLNAQLAPFKIFKGSEVDILADGSLDYDVSVLAQFDFVVASVHSGLNMETERATRRLLAAICNPYTTILGHPTGRLLLRRSGYPIDYETIIDACVAHGVIIEINANPWRLDLDWRWVHYAISKGAMLSINPDAHTIEGYGDVQYGVLVAQKGGIAKANTFNAWSLEEVTKHFEQRKANRIPFRLTK